MVTTARRPQQPIVRKPQESILSKAQKPSKIPVRTGLIYSGPGVGKTHLLGTASEIVGVRVLIITLDRYDETLAKFPKADVIDLPGVVQGSLHNGMEELVKELRLSPKKWDLVCFDSISKLMHMTRVEIVRGEYEKDKADKRLQSYQWHDPEIPEQRDYLRVTNRLSNYFWDLRNIAINKGFHFFITGWERDEWLVDDQHLDGTTFYYPDLPPELRRLILHEFGFCVRLTSSRTSRREVSKGKIKVIHSFKRVLLADSRDAVVKNRIDLPNTMVNPTAATLLGTYEARPQSEEVVEELPTEETPGGEQSTDGPDGEEEGKGDKLNATENQS